ncbi:mitochondrial carrier protein-like protein [Rhizodiscina lignyota]|uniref:Mitochondrial carrier protein-like protein n=1 Tax=Rhizodiscina lignyota TaxID=1504668 RepID=A0A9P4MBN5_9PEZI|nr:mitochondrial carrier protein-like protein [Rhizodiscina lignyota]
MVLGEVARYFASADSGTAYYQNGSTQGKRHGQSDNSEGWSQEAMAQEADLELARPSYFHVALAGGLGGTTGDMMMHSLDTVKTRQQGDPHMPPKYTSLGSSYYTIWRQEGIRRGLYGGVLPAFLGSFSGTVIFFGTYEWSKRMLLDAGVAPSIAYFSGGFFADLVAAPVYVPSEVLKTRLQLQGRYNNPHFQSGYNYRGTLDATRTIIRTEGIGALFYGLKATLYRDLPYSALQFAFWEQEQNAARAWLGKKDIGLPLEILTGATAGSMAGIITCPLDVVKTRIQTQINPSALSHAPASHTGTTGKSTSPARHSTHQSAGSKTHQSNRPISTSPATSLKPHTAATLDTSSVLKGLRLIYRTEGLRGWFRGVGPRAVWTGIQSGTMFVLYASFLRWFEKHPLISDVDA